MVAVARAAGEVGKGDSRGREEGRGTGVGRSQPPPVTVGETCSLFRGYRHEPAAALPQLRFRSSPLSRPPFRPWGPSFPTSDVHSPVFPPRTRFSSTSAHIPSTGLSTSPSSTTESRARALKGEYSPCSILVPGIRPRRCCPSLRWRKSLDRRRGRAEGGDDVKTGRGSVSSQSLWPKDAVANSPSRSQTHDEAPMPPPPR